MVVSQPTTEPSAVDVAVRRRSPLVEHGSRFAAASATHRQVDIVEEPFIPEVNLRLHPGSPAVARVESVFGVALPTTPNTVSGNADHGVLWLGPDEWLIVGHPHQPEALRSAIGDNLGSTVDQSASRTVIRVSGSGARELLEQLCSVDLHPREFGTGRCAQTLLGRAQAIVWRISDEPSYRILVCCSLAGYVADSLLDRMGPVERTGETTS